MNKQAVDVKNQNETCLGRVQSVQQLSKLTIFRVFTTALLVTVIVLGGYGSYYVLNRLEEENASNEFASYRRQIESNAQSNLLTAIRNSRALASVYAEECPTDADWPKCLLDLDYMDELSANIFLKPAGLCVFVTPPEVSDYEDFIFEAYVDVGLYDVSSVKGIFGLSLEIGGPDFRYKIDNGSFGVPLMAPISQLGSHKDLARSVVFYDEYSEITRFHAINEILNCSAGTSEFCSILSGTITFPASLTSPLDKIPPKCLLFTGVNPKLSNSSKARGAVISAVEWDIILSNIIPVKVDGIECIIQIDENGFLFEIERSIAVFKKKLDGGDTDGGVSLNYFDGQSEYSLIVRRTADFNKDYSTDGPIIACFLFVIIILVISIVFFGYDQFVNKQILQKEIIMKTKQMFVRYISHEIRTPMNTIHLGISLIYEELKTALIEGRFSEELTKKLGHWLDITSSIESSSTSAIQVLNDLLDYEQIQISKLNMEMTQVSPWRVVETVFQAFKYNMEAKGISGTLRMDINEDAPGAPKEGDRFLPEQKKKLLVLGDPKKIEQAVRNFVSNAIKFTPAGGNIEVSARWIPVSKSKLKKVRPSVDGYICVTVKDTGVGMTAKQIQALFNEGAQFDTNRLLDGKGSGLGLWITKGIIEEHKGIVYAESQGPGMGSTFGLELPVINDNNYVFEHELKPTKTTRLGYHRPLSGAKVKNILIVDDATATVKMVKRILTSAGFTCKTAYNGLECLEVMEFEDFHKSCDLILIDNHMPGMDGPRTVEEMRKRGYLTPIYGVTGSVGKDELSEFMSFGCDGVLEKPLRLDVLKKIISDIEEENNWLSCGADVVL